MLAGDGLRFVRDEPGNGMGLVQEIFEAVPLQRVQSRLAEVAQVCVLLMLRRHGTHLPIASEYVASSMERVRHRITICPGRSGRASRRREPCGLCTT